MVLAHEIADPLSSLIDAVVADPAACADAKRTLIALRGTLAFDQTVARLSAVIAEAEPDDRWTRRARPSFLYVMYALLLWSIPMGLIAGVEPAAAANILAGMKAYLNGIPEPLYALFGTGYLGYTVARQWGKTQAAGK